MDPVTVHTAYGMPLRIGRYPQNASADDRRVLLHAVRSIASDAAAVIPVGMELEFAKVEGQHGSAVFGGLIEYTDKQVSKLILGQTMTSDEGGRGGGGLAQAKVHNEVRQDILRADGRQISNTVSRDLINNFVAFNFGPQPAYPRCNFPVSEPDDIDALSKALGILVPLGLKVGQREVRGKIGMSDPEKDEDLLVQPAPATPLPPEGVNGPASPPPVPGRKPAALAALSGHVAGCRCGGCLARTSADPADHAADGLDLTDALLAAAAADFAEVSDPLLGPLALAATRAASLDEALAMIRRRGPDGAALLERLAIATATARGIGDAAD